MKEILAKTIIGLVIPFGLYWMFIAMACWTPECFRDPWHPEIAVITVAFLAVLWAMYVLWWDK